MWGDALSYTLALQTALSICVGQVETLNAWLRLFSVSAIKSKK
ncbi:UNVERIFIED_ORG: hypothetical protein EOZ59_0999 [Serratia quinivorans]